MPPWRGLFFHHPKVGNSGPLSSLSPPHVPSWCQVGSFWIWGWRLALRGQMRASDLSPPCPGVGLANPGKWPGAHTSHLRTPSRDCPLNSSFQESCIFLG